MSKLSTKELKKLKDQLTEISKLKAAIGELEISYQVQKQSLLAQATAAQTKFNDLGKDIEEEYGKCTIDINTGELTPVEEDVDVKQLKQE
jgi:hypothetical protein